MKVHLDLKTVQDLEKTIRNGGVSHQRDGIQLLQKWLLEPNLEYDAETQHLMTQLAAEFLRPSTGAKTSPPAPTQSAPPLATAVSFSVTREVQPPKVFVSYTHESKEHKLWVNKLAKDLRANGVDVILDKWDLKKGAELTKFMESGIREASRVLLIFTPAYCKKANLRSGGVGYESLVITGELVLQLDTTKFIGILRSGDWENSVPSFLASRNHLDFRNDAEYQELLDELLRELHGAPADPKPPVGRNPFTLHIRDQQSNIDADKGDQVHRPRRKQGDASSFIRDVTIPDGSYVKVGQEFEKVWEIQNAGTVIWKNRFLKREGSREGICLLESPEKVPIPETHPGQVIQVSVSMKAPNIPTTTTCIWKMVDENGNKCFPDKYPYGLVITVHVVE